MDTKSINTREEYSFALKRFEEIFSAKIGTKESDEANILALIIKDYEDKHFVIERQKIY